jgi:hypothetical protein
MWKNSLYKWDSWVYNRHRNAKVCDDWSRFIIEDCVGETAVFNSGGMFFKDFMPDATVIEFDYCPVNVNGIVYLKDQPDLLGKFDNLIMINPISLKYNSSIFDFLSNAGISRAGLKPNLLSWLKQNGKIYLSTLDWHIYYDRLKFTVHDMVAYQLRELEKNGIRCKYLEISNVNSDIENGNIKLVLSVNKSYNININ